MNILGSSQCPISDRGALIKYKTRLTAAGVCGSI
jgi:hypothetical protein